jgi:hypothetical protein
MSKTPPTLIERDSNLFLNSLLTQSASELGGLGAGNRRRRSDTGRADESHAEAEGLRAFGGIIQQINCRARGHYAVMTPKQRAGRWRAAGLTLNDGLTDGTEDSDANGLQTFGETDPNDPDTDGDGLADGWIDQQVWNSSSGQFEACADGTAGVFDAWEGEDSDKDGEVDMDANETMLETSAIMKDSDGDGLWDGDEVKPEMIAEDDVANPNEYVTDALNGDTDSDGISDYMEIVGWNMTTYWEATFEVRKDKYMVYSDPTDSDTDNDGLLDGDEYAYTGDPTDADSNDDGINDKSEVNVGSKPGDSDGIAPIIYTIDCWVDPIVKTGSNGIKFLSGIKIKVTVNASDSSGVHYIELEINNKVVRKYLQNDQVQTNITNELINLTTDYPFDEQDQLIIRVVDYYGNVNESGMIPDDYWPNFRGQNWVDPYVKLRSTAIKGKKYASYYYKKSITKLPNKIKSQIKGALKRSIADLYSSIKNKYDRIKHKNNKAYINSIQNLWKVQFSSLVLYNFMKIINSRNYNMIKINILNLYGIRSISPKHKLNFHTLLNKLYYDLNILEKTFKKSPKVLKDLKVFITSSNRGSLPSALNKEFKWFLKNDDKYGNYGVPKIIRKGYGFELIKNKIYYDIDKDGITNSEEIQVTFRPSRDARMKYKSGWVAVNVDLGYLIGCGYEREIKNYNLNRNIWTSAGNPMEFIKKGYTWNKKIYLVFIKPRSAYYKGGNDIYIVYIITSLRSNGRATISVYSSEKKDSMVYNDQFQSGGYYFIESKLCPKANPIIKDIFVEVDWMRKNTKSYKFNGVFFWDNSLRSSNDQHKIKGKTKNYLINKFKKHGINIHFDDGNYYGGGPIKHLKKLTKNDWKRWRENWFIDPTRRSVYHHCIFGHKGQKKKVGHFSNANFIVYAKDRTKDDQTKIFMHELGHTLGLDHSGYRYSKKSVMYHAPLSGYKDFSKKEWKKIKLNEYL